MGCLQRPSSSVDRGGGGGRWRIERSGPQNSGLAASSQRIFASRRNSSASTTRARPTSSGLGTFLETRELLHRLDEVTAVHLHDVAHVDIRAPTGDQHLDGEFVAGRGAAMASGAASHATSSLPAVVGQAEHVLATARSGAVGLDEAVSLEVAAGSCTPDPR